MAAAKKQSNAMNIPDGVFSLLASADEKNGLPAGTMASLMQQEIGGNSRFLNDPTAYHYAANDKGQRIAGHTGKISTAFGPFGILESTAKDPGYGVAPLKDKSIEEQVRFASEYLAGRSKASGGLSAGLAGYGEGTKYAKQVTSRIGGGRGVVNPPSVVPAMSPVQEAAVPEMLAQQVVASSLPPEQVVAQAQSVNQPASELGPNPWLAFQEGMQQKQQVVPTDLAYEPTLPNSPDFMATVGGPSAVPTNQFNGYRRPDRNQSMAFLRQIGAIG